MNRGQLARLLAPAWLLVSCALATFASEGPKASPQGGAAAVTPLGAPAPSGGPASSWIKGYFPNFVLTTHENEKVRFYDDLVRGKVVLVNFMFTTCSDICPMVTAKLVKVQAALADRVGRDVFMYSISLDPARDTPAVLKRYAKAFGAGPGWVFLTGKQAEIEVLRRKLGLYDPDPVIDADRTQHSGLIIYGNDAADRWSAIPALVKPERIVEAVLRLAAAKKG